MKSTLHARFIASIVMTHYLFLGSTSSWPTDVVRWFSSHILHSETLISGKLDEFMQLQEQRNLKVYAFLFDILICNMKLNLRYITYATLRILNEV